MIHRPQSVIAAPDDAIALTATRPRWRRPSTVPRRGVLLLVVLSMLTLFLMLGAAYLVAATRAREAARAYARLTLGSDDARVPHAQLLDSVLLRVVRGPWISGTTIGPVISGNVVPIAGGTISFESLLADKYGATAVSGTASSVSGTGPIVTVNATLSVSLQPTDLNGRVLTFAAAGRQATSHRIIRAQAGTGPNPDTSNTAATAFKLALDTPVTAGPFTVPTAGRIIINQREFIGSGSAGSPNEPWDGFDSANPFLARTGTMTISTSTVSRISYLPTLATTTLSGTWDYDSDGIPDAADNDNDGSWDGAFLDVGIPDMVDGNGNAVRLRASVLILDLDGRFNVNAHDSLARIAYSGTNLWPTQTGTTIPMGSGYGPAEVNGAKMFQNITSGTENPLLVMMVGGSSSWLSGTRAANSRFTQSGSTPRLDIVDGRYGRDKTAMPPWPAVVPTGSTTLLNNSLATSLPGIAGTNDMTSNINDRRADPSQASDFSYGVPTVWWTGGTAAFNWAASPSIGGAQPLPRGVFNSPPDLHGRMRTTTGTAAGSPIVPQLFFGKPEWSAGSASFESTDDPYELNLDTRTGRGGWLHDPATSGVSNSASFADNPFLLSELEPVLRPYDGDSNRLAMRLAAILGSAAEESRMKVTTDSWDTTAITGSAAQAVFGWLADVTGTASLYGTTPTDGNIGGEIARGERLDINRALEAASSNNIGYPSVTGTAYGAATYVFDGRTLSNFYHIQRNAYRKDLYTLLVALDPTASTSQLAQWVANVAEFRDADSRVTPFEYDANLSNGWGVDCDVKTGTEPDRAVVWGAERPEIVIQAAFAWRNSVTGSSGMFIALHRPWSALAYATGSTTITAEPCDYAFDSLVGITTGDPQNAINLGKKPSSQIYEASYSGTTVLDCSSTVYPIWRLRIVTSDSTQFVACTGTSPDWIGSPSVTTGLQAPTLGTGSTFTVATGTVIPTGNPVSGTGAVTSSFTGGSLVMPTLKLPPAATSGTIYLERLSDPTVSLTTSATVPGCGVSGSTIWRADPLTASGTAAWPVAYLVVDSLPLTTICETSVSTALSGTWNTRGTSSAQQAFWGEKTTSVTSVPNNGTISCPPSLNPGNTAWFPWPNRPFVSSAELLLVPRGTALEILSNYQRPTPSNQASVGIPVPLNLLFDAVHVPTRFAGIHRTYTANHSASTGIFNSVTVTTPVNQLSSFREPGRVNLNTVGFDDVWDAVVAGPLSAAVTPRSTANLFSTGTSAKSMVNLLSLSVTGTVVVSDTNSATTVLAHDKNPMHAIYTATRLANTVTPRSNVFAVWITLRESTANDPDSVRYRRAFYIIDRSIPVGYEEGRDHNVRDAIRLRRIIE